MQIYTAQNSHLINVVGKRVRTSYGPQEQRIYRSA